MTREIAVQPSGCDSESFLWRVSIAEVNSAAPFSFFPGVDRHIMLLDGSGFTMTLNDECTHVLQTRFEPFAFAGEARVAVTLTDGPTRDFNLMVQRGLARGEMVICRGPGIQPLDPATVLVYAACGETTTPDGVLQAGDAWCVSPSTTASVTLAPGAVGVAVRIERSGKATGQIAGLK